jgi:hypothetical protein
VLTISGEGAMPDFSFNFDETTTAPWWRHGNLFSAVFIEDGVTTVGRAAFGLLGGLKEIIIGNSVTSIGEMAFLRSGLTSVTIPASVRTIVEYAFFRASNLVDINVNSENMAFSSEYGVLFNKSKTSLIKYPEGKTGAYTIPSSVLFIERSAFRESNLTEVTIPNSVMRIGISAFSSTKLTEIVIPNSVLTIGDWAFRGTDLTEVTIPNSVTSIGNRLFSGCTNLVAINVDVENEIFSSEDGVLFNKSKTELIIYPEGKTGVYTIPNSVTDVRGYAFMDARNLREITIPSSVTTVGNSTFSNIPNLTTLNINTSSIPRQIFSRSLVTVNFGNEVKEIPDRFFENFTNLTSVTIPNSVTSIGGAAFANTNLTSVTIPNSVTSIEAAVFANTNLIEITIPSSVMSIGDWAFSGTNLTEVTIPNSVTTIGARAFANTGLIEVTIPNSVTSIEVGAFLRNNIKTMNFNAINLSANVSHDQWGSHFRGAGITTLNIGDEVQWIPDGAFGGNPITELNISNSVRSIGMEAFSNNSALTSLVIPNSVWEIWHGAFEGNRNLTEITISGPIHFSNNVFRDSRNLTKIINLAEVPRGLPVGVFPYSFVETPTLYVQSANVSAYRDADCDWRRFKIVCYGTHGDLNDWLETTAPTCESDGIETRACTVCDKTDVETRTGTPKLGHDWIDNWITINLANCFRAGNEERTCARADCDHNENRDIPQLTELDGCEPSSIRNRQNTDSRYGILLENAIVSDMAKISVITLELSTVNLAILDNLGNVVFETNGRSDEDFVWNLTNNAGRFVGNGTYLVLVEAISVSGRRFTYSARLGVNR